MVYPENKYSLREIWKGFWHLLWKDNSFKGWIISIIVLFVFIKFIFFPVVSFATGTQLPLAIVESCSMYHQGNLLSNFNSWWDSNGDKYSQFNLTKENFSSFIFEKGFNKGDILFITGVDPKKIKVGDVIIFVTVTSNPVIHRVVKITETSEGRIFSTYGDNNRGQLIFEHNIKENQIIGKARFKLLPYAGWIKLVFFEPFKDSSERGFCSAN